MVFMNTKIAIVITELNEHELLRNNILYHRYLGVKEFIIFADDPKDGSLESIKDIPGITTLPSIHPDNLPPELRVHPKMAKIIKQYSSHHCARQMINSMYAYIWASNIGCDWLLSMDTDEFICPNLNDIKPNAIADLFNCQPQKVETLLFRPLEIIPSSCASRTVFNRDLLFLNEFIPVKKGFKSLRRIQRYFSDPILGKKHAHKGYLGHVDARSAIRLKLDIVPCSTHYFIAASGAKLVQREIGWSLHFYCYSFEDFLKKFKNFRTLPDQWVSGAAIEWPYGMFRDMVNGGNMNIDDLRRYYETYMVPNAKNIDEWTAAFPGAVVSVSTVRKVFERIAATMLPCLILTVNCILAFIKH